MLFTVLLDTLNASVAYSIEGMAQDSHRVRANLLLSNPVLAISNILYAYFFAVATISFSLPTRFLPLSWMFTPRYFAIIVSVRLSPLDPTFQFFPLGPVVSKKVLLTANFMCIFPQNRSTMFRRVVIPLIDVLEMRMRSSAKNIPLIITPPSLIPNCVSCILIPSPEMYNEKSSGDKQQPCLTYTIKHPYMNVSF